MSNPVLVERYEFDQITTGDLSGTGLFDILMASVKKHIQEEYDSNRIRNKEYADVYLGGLQAVLQNTIQYIVGSALVKEQRANSEAELVGISINNDKSKYELDYLMPLQKQGLELVNEKSIFENVNLLPLQKDQLTKQNTGLGLQNTGLEYTNFKLNYENTELLPLQKIQLTAQNTSLASQNEGLTLTNTKLAYENTELLPLQKAQLTSQNEGLTLTNTGLGHTNTKLDFENTKLLPLQESQLLLQNNRLTTETTGLGIANAIAIYQRDVLQKLEKSQIIAGTSKLNQDSALSAKQVDEITYRIKSVYPEEVKKVTSEISLITAKTTSEKAMPALTEAQESLVNTQRKGFDRDAEAKIGKMLADAYTTRKTVDEYSETPYYLSDEYIDYFYKYTLINNLIKNTPDPTQHT